MTTWSDFTTAEPDFAARVQAVFEARTHKVLSTVRRDGSPRLSGIELTFADGGARIGSMPGSRKSMDLARDPRLAVHVSSADPPKDNPGAWAGDATIYGRAEPANRGPDDADGTFYEIDLTEVILVRVAPTNDHLIIESWTPARGYRKVTRT